MIFCACEVINFLQCYNKIDLCVWIWCIIFVLHIDRAFVYVVIFCIEEKLIEVLARKVANMAQNGVRSQVYPLHFS